MVIEMLFTNIKDQYLRDIIDIVKIIGEEINEITLKHVSHPVLYEYDTNTFRNQSFSYQELYYYGIFSDFSSDLNWYEITYKKSKYGLAIYSRNDSMDRNSSFAYIKIIFKNNRIVRHLYNLKILIKEKLREFYRHFYWLSDDQAKRFNTTCYNKIFDLENQMRRLVTASFIKLFGIEWWEEKAPKELKTLAHKYSKSSAKIGGKTWKDVQHYVYNINVDDLLDLMKKERADLQVTDEVLGQKFRACTNPEEVLELKKKTEKYSLWDEYFSKLFGDKEFPDKWVTLTSYRNYVAHNKFMDYKAFLNFEPLYKYLNSHLYNAYTKLPNISLSDKEQLRISLLLEPHFRETPKLNIETEKRNRINFLLASFEELLQEELLPVLISFCEKNDYSLILETTSLTSNFVVVGYLKGVSAEVEIDKVIKIDENNEIYRFGVLLEGTNTDFDCLLPIPLRIEENQVIIDERDELITAFKQILSDLTSILESYKIPLVNWENTPIIYDDTCELLDEDFFEDPEDELYYGVIEGYHYEFVNNNGQDIDSKKDLYDDPEYHSDDYEVERYYLEFREDDYED